VGGEEFLLLAPQTDDRGEREGSAQTSFEELAKRVGRDPLVDAGALREAADDPTGRVTVVAASVPSRQQRSVGAFGDCGVDRTGGPWGERACNANLDQERS
jgi:hypothetical protein